MKTLLLAYQLAKILQAEKIKLLWDLWFVLPTDKYKGLLAGTHSVHRNPPRGVKRPRKEEVAP